MITNEIIDGEQNLWVGVIHDAWYTAIRKNTGDTKRPNQETNIKREKEQAFSFFRDKNGMLPWICDVTNINYGFITDLFEKSLTDKKMKETILNTYRRMHYNRKNIQTVEEESEYQM